VTKCPPIIVPEVRLEMAGYGKVIIDCMSAFDAFGAVLPRAAHPLVLSLGKTAPKAYTLSGSRRERCSVGQVAYRIKQIAV